MLCPKCGTENISDAAFCMECGMPLPKIEKEIVKDRKKKRIIKQKTPAKQNSLRVWKALTFLGILLSVTFMLLLVNTTIAYDELREDYKKLVRENREYIDLQEKYEQLEKWFDRYNLEDRYAIQVTSVYNGNAEFSKINDSLDADYMDSVVVRFITYDYSDNWSDPVYVDVIDPTGTIINPVQNNHTFMIYVGNQNNDWCIKWDPNGQAGIYKLKFYQGDIVIHVHEFELT